MTEIQVKAVASSLALLSSRRGYLFDFEKGLFDAV